MHQAEYIGIIRDTKVTTDLILFNIFSADDDDDFGLIGQLA